MGTVGYMSPEQVRGTIADNRSDIFSFGVILYEMLTGKRAFGGESVVETMHAILKEDVPDFDDSGTRVPPAVEKLMRRCLEKKPEHRFHSAHDLGFALDAVSSPTSSSGSGLTVAANSLREAPVASRASWLSRAAWIAAAVFLISTIVLAALYFRRETPRSETMRFAIPAPEKSSFTEAFELAPNGQALAFVAREPPATQRYGSGRSLQSTHDNCQEPKVRHFLSGHQTADRSVSFQAVSFARSMPSAGRPRHSPTRRLILAAERG
jgi:serine/threonine protein kinase